MLLAARRGHEHKRVHSHIRDLCPKVTPRTPAFPQRLPPCPGASLSSARLDLHGAPGFPQGSSHSRLLCGSLLQHPTSHHRDPGQSRACQPATEGQWGSETPHHKGWGKMERTASYSLEWERRDCACFVLGQSLT